MSGPLLDVDHVPKYDLDALASHAESQRGDMMAVDTDEMLALLAEFRRLEAVVEAALMWRGDRTTHGWLAQAVDAYQAQRVDMGLEPRRTTP